MLCKKVERYSFSEDLICKMLCVLEIVETFLSPGTIQVQRKSMIFIKNITSFALMYVENVTTVQEDHR